MKKFIVLLILCASFVFAQRFDESCYGACKLDCVNSGSARDCYAVCSEKCALASDVHPQVVDVAVTKPVARPLPVKIDCMQVQERLDLCVKSGATVAVCREKVGPVLFECERSSVPPDAVRVPSPMCIDNCESSCVEGYFGCVGQDGVLPGDRAGVRGCDLQVGKCLASCRVEQAESVEVVAAREACNKQCGYLLVCSTSECAVKYKGCMGSCLGEPIETVVPQVVGAGVPVGVSCKDRCSDACTSSRECHDDWLDCLAVCSGEEKEPSVAVREQVFVKKEPKLSQESSFFGRLWARLFG